MATTHPTTLATGSDETVLVLGTSLLATDVARSLTSIGAFARVYTVGTCPAAKRSQHRRIDFFDRGAPRRLAGVLGDLQPRVVVALAGSQSPVTPERRGHYDLIIARAVLSALRVWHARGGRARTLLSLSSTAVYGLARTSPLVFSEADRVDGHNDPEPASVYGRWVRELRETEALYREAGDLLGTGVATLRAAPVVAGPIASQLTDYLDARFPVRVAGYDPPVQVVHYSDLVQAVLRAIEARVTGTINVVGGGVVALSRLGALSGRLLLPLPPRAARFFAPDALGTAPLCWRCVADGSRAVQMLGVAPQFSAEEALGG